MNNINAFIQGLPTFFIGIIVVFSMLVLLILFIIALGKVIQMLTNKPKENKAEISVAENEVAATIEETNSQDETELIAVITAVIAASMGTTSDQLQVRSLRKVQRRSL